MRVRQLSVFVVGCTLAACGEPIQQVVVDAGVQAPGQTPPDAGVPYPPPPYGNVAGDTLQDVKLYGYKDESAPWSLVRMSDFFDPDGNRGPEGKPIKLLLVNVSAMWCSACKTEAPIMGAACREYAGRGLACYTAIYEDEDRLPATRSDVNDWAAEFKVVHTIVLDAPFKWGAYFRKEATPMNMFVDPRTMKILEIHSGFDQNAMRQVIETYTQ